MAPNTTLSPRQRRGIDHHRPAEPVLDIGDLRLDLALALLGGMIFGILGKVAMAARFLDRVDDRRPLDRLQVTDVVLQLLIALGQHRQLVDRRHSLRAFRQKLVLSDACKSIA